RLAPPRRYLAPCPVEPGLSSAFLRMTRLPGRLRRGHCLTLPRLEAANYPVRDIASDTHAMRSRSRSRLRLRVRLRLILTFGAPPERRRRRTRPRRGAAHGCAAFSARTGCPLGKSRRLRGPGAKHRARRPGCAFFAPGFFAQAKKGGSRRHGAKALDLAFAATGDTQEQEQLAALAPSSALRAPSPASGRRAGTAAGAQTGGVLFAPGFFAQAKKGG